jgi:hypothetical protein
LTETFTYLTTLYCFVTRLIHLTVRAYDSIKASPQRIVHTIETSSKPKDKRGTGRATSDIFSKSSFILLIRYFIFTNPFTVK